MGCWLKNWTMFLCYWFGTWCSVVVVVVHGFTTTTVPYNSMIANTNHPSVHNKYYHYNENPIVTTTTTSSSMTRRTGTMLHLSVDPIVVAAAGMAVVGGLGTVLITSKLRELDEEEGGGKVSPDVVAPPQTPEEPTLEPEPEVVVISAKEEDDDEDIVDVSIPYDAAAKLAYEQAGSPGDYNTFKTQYEADSVADAIAKKKERDIAE